MQEYAAIIEIPKGSKIKYEIDHETNELILDRILYTSFGYPANYGFIKNTLAEDGDPLDVLVLTEHHILPQTKLKIRPVGVLKMLDEKGTDPKIIGVLKDDPMYLTVLDVLDVNEHIREEIQHFFEHYKDLETDKWAKVDCWADKKEAEKLIKESIEAYKNK